MFLPLSSDLVLMKYHDSSEKKTGYVFFYPSQDKTWLIESDDTNSYINQDQEATLKFFENSMKILLFIIHQNRLPKENSDMELFKQYCLDANSDLIYKSKSLYFIIGEEKGPNKNKISEKK